MFIYNYNYSASCVSQSFTIQFISFCPWILIIGFIVPKLPSYNIFSMQHQIIDVIPSLVVLKWNIPQVAHRERGLRGRDPCQGVIVGRGPGGSWKKLGLALRDWVWQRRPYPRRGHSAGPRAGQRGCFQHTVLIQGYFLINHAREIYIHIHELDDILELFYES